MTTPTGPDFLYLFGKPQPKRVFHVKTPDTYDAECGIFNVVIHAHEAGWGVVILTGSLGLYNDGMIDDEGNVTAWERLGFASITEARDWAEEWFEAEISQLNKAFERST
jgi:hypothetical protein